MFSRCLAAMVGGIIALVCATALADPPARVARLSLTAGTVSFSPAADPDNWVEARVNRPVFIGDRLWTTERSRVELELGSAVVRAGDDTSLTLLNLDDRLTQLELAQGRVNVRVRTLASDEAFEIDTPNLAFAITRPGNYRVEVDSQGGSTVVAIRDGRGEVYGEGASYVVDRGQWYRFYGTALENDYARLPVVDDFDRWALAREARHDRSTSARYVSRAVIGYDDLDEYGSWSVVPQYGNVWVPRTVPADWAPYRNGHWVWIDPWGWTWVDDAPWGFAPFHYGRWAYANAHWMWVPGPANVRPVYAPALVAFVGGNDLTINVGTGDVRGVAWFPLAPGEVYRPPYRVTRNYFTEINVTNTRVDSASVVRVYDNPNATRDMRYRHRGVPNAVTAVAVNAFVESRPVARAALPPRQVAEVVQRAPVLSAPVVAPARASVIGAASPAPARPPAAMAQRHVVAKREPPAALPTYTPHELNVNAANVVDANAQRNAAPRLRERVRVVTPAQPTMAGSAAPHRGQRADAATPPNPQRAHGGASPASTPAGAPAANATAPAASAPSAPAANKPAAGQPPTTMAAPEPPARAGHGDRQGRDRGRAPATSPERASTPVPANGSAAVPPRAPPTSAANPSPPAAATPPAQPTATPSTQPATPSAQPAGTRPARPAATPSAEPEGTRPARPAATPSAQPAGTRPQQPGAAPSVVAPERPPAAAPVASGVPGRARGNGGRGPSADQPVKGEPGAPGTEPSGAARPETRPAPHARAAAPSAAPPAAPTMAPPAAGPAAKAPNVPARAVPPRAAPAPPAEAAPPAAAAAPHPAPAPAQAPRAEQRGGAPAAAEVRGERGKGSEDRSHPGNDDKGNGKGKAKQEGKGER